MNHVPELCPPLSSSCLRTPSPRAAQGWRSLAIGQPRISWHQRNMSRRLNSQGPPLWPHFLSVDTSWMSCWWETGTQELLCLPYVSKIIIIKVVSLPSGYIVLARGPISPLTWRVVEWWMNPNCLFPVFNSEKAVLILFLRGANLSYTWLCVYLWGQGGLWGFPLLCHHAVFRCDYCLQRYYDRHGALWCQGPWGLEPWIWNVLAQDTKEKLDVCLARTQARSFIFGLLTTMYFGGLAFYLWTSRLCTLVISPQLNVNGWDLKWPQFILFTGRPSVLRLCICTLLSTYCRWCT